MASIIVYNGWEVLDTDDPPGAGGDAIQDNFKQLANILDATNIGTGYIDVGYHLRLDADARRIYFGAGNDAYIEFDGDSLNIVTNAVTATDDLLITASNITLDATGLLTVGDLTVGDVTAADITASQIALGGAAVTDDALRINWSPIDDSAAHGLDMVLTGAASVSGTYHNYGFQFALYTNIAAGVTNSGSIRAVHGQALHDSAGTLATLYGLNFLFGNYGTAGGNTTTAIGLRMGGYKQTGTIDTFKYIEMCAPVGGGAITTGWGIHDASSYDWWLAADNKCIRMGATSTDLALYSDGTNAVLGSAGDVILNPTGNVKFGAHSAIGAETVTGYITIKDAAGNLRKLAVVS